MKTTTTHTNSQEKPLVGHENLLAQNKLGETYNTIQEGIVEWNVDSFTQAANNTSWPGMTLLLVGLSFVVIIAWIIETWTVFGVILPSDIILSATVIALIVLKQWRMVAIVVALSILFTIVGDQIGYYTWYKLWSNLYDKQDTRYFKKKYLIQAQEALNRGGENFLYKWRFVAFGGFLPMIYGMMKRDRTRFFKVSALSGALRKLSIVIPLVLVLLLFPGLQSHFVILIALVAAIPEIIGWIVLLFPEFKKYKARLSGAKEQIDTIRGSFGEIIDVLSTPTEEQAQLAADREEEQAQKQQEMIAKDEARKARHAAWDYTLGEKILMSGQQAWSAALGATASLGSAIGSKVTPLLKKSSSSDEARSEEIEFSTSETQAPQKDNSTQVLEQTTTDNLAHDNIPHWQSSGQQQTSSPQESSKYSEESIPTHKTDSWLLAKAKTFGKTIGSKAVSLTHSVGKTIEEKTWSLSKKASSLLPKKKPDSPEDTEQELIS